MPGIHKRPRPHGGVSNVNILETIYRGVMGPTYTRLDIFLHDSKRQLGNMVWMGWLSYWMWR